MKTHNQIFIISFLLTSSALWAKRVLCILQFAFFLPPFWEDMWRALCIAFIFFPLMGGLRGADTTWRCTYGGAGYDEGRSVIETFDTCYMVAGATASRWPIGIGYGDAD